MQVREWWWLGSHWLIARDVAQEVSKSLLSHLRDLELYPEDKGSLLVVFFCLFTFLIKGLMCPVYFLRILFTSQEGSLEGR